MATHTINASTLKTGAMIFVRGNVVYSRITKHVAGEELKKEAERIAKMGQIPPRKPFTRIQIQNAQIVPANPQGVLSNEERFVAELFYSSQKYTGMCMNTTNYSKILPYVSQVREGHPEIVDQIRPEGELAPGLDVVLVYQVYEAQNYGRKTIGLQGIICQEPVRYWSADQTEAAMKERGITYNRLQDDNRMPEQEDAASSQPIPPVAAPVGNAYTNDPSRQAPMQTQQNPIPGMNAPENAQAPAPQAPTQGGFNPFNPNGPIGGGGIRYDN